MIQRLKVAEKERDALESKKQEAELFLDKQARFLRHKVNSFQINALQRQVRQGVAAVGRGARRVTCLDGGRVGSRHAACRREGLKAGVLLRPNV